jgi:hypothetical protein
MQGPFHLYTMVRCRNRTEALRIFKRGHIDCGDQFRKPHRTEIDLTITSKKCYRTCYFQGNVVQPLAIGSFKSRASSPIFPAETAPPCGSASAIIAKAFWEGPIRRLCFASCRLKLMWASAPKVNGESFISHLASTSQ